MAQQKSKAQHTPPGAPKPAESKNRNLALRLATAFVLIPIVLGCIYWGGLALTTLAAVAAGLNALELGTMMLGKDRLRLLAAVAAFAMPYFFTVEGLGPQNIHWLWAGLVIATLAWRLLRDAPVDSAGNDTAATVFAGVYGSLVGYVVPLRNVGAVQSWRGGGWVLLACVLTWINDTGAYFAGRFLGKHKLYPRISPAKTWEGFFGGMAAAIAGAFIVRALVLDILTPGDCLILGIVCSFFGPMGDLAESMLKRAFKVKDSGNLLPGHGGMLDRVDALMINAPIVYFYYQLFIVPRGAH